MTNDKGDNVIMFPARPPEDEVARINKTTGLLFEDKPESLLGRQEEWEAFAETLLGRAITFWDVGGN